MNSYWYRAYGLQIFSELLLPVPQSRPGEADVMIRLGQIEASPPGINGSKSLLRATPQEICCQWEPMGRVLVRQGRHIIVDPNPGLSSENVAPWVQGAALSLALHQRGYLVMHASAVAVDGVAVAFVGEVGWGKSTTAAAMHARGHRLLADDIVAIRVDGGGQPMVISGFPHLKLTDEAIRFIGEDPTSLGHVLDDPHKLLRISKAPLPSEPLPLAAVFVLGEGDTCSVDPMSAVRAMPELMRHAFVARQTNFLKLTNTDRIHFRNCTELIRHASICHLRRPKSFELLPRLAALAEEHVIAKAAAVVGK
jgi:hypothetical protein